jgi:hypothetical protein
VVFVGHLNGAEIAVGDSNKECSVQIDSREESGSCTYRHAQLLQNIKHKFILTEIFGKCFYFSLLPIYTLLPDYNCSCSVRYRKELGFCEVHIPLGK